MSVSLTHILLFREGRYTWMANEGKVEGLQMREVVCVEFSHGLLLREWVCGCVGVKLLLYCQEENVGLTVTHTRLLRDSV